MYSVIEINEKKYMNTKTAANLWNVRQSTVSDYCKTGKIKGAIRLDNRSWGIPIDAHKPLPDSSIKKLLLLVLQLKNNPTLDIDWTVIELQNKDIESTYKNLVALEYIKDFQVNGDEPLTRIPYNVQLTQKGIDFISNNKEKTNFDWTAFLIKTVPAILEIGSIILKSKAS